MIIMRNKSSRLENDSLQYPRLYFKNKFNTVSRLLVKDY